MRPSTPHSCETISHITVHPRASVVDPLFWSSAASCETEAIFLISTIHHGFNYEDLFCASPQNIFFISRCNARARLLVSLPNNKSRSVSAVVVPTFCRFGPFCPPTKLHNTHNAIRTLSFYFFSLPHRTDRFVLFFSKSPMTSGRPWPSPAAHPLLLPRTTSPPPPWSSAGSP